MPQDIERQLFDSGNFPAIILDRIWGKGEVSVGYCRKPLNLQSALTWLVSIPYDP